MLSIIPMVGILLPLIGMYQCLGIGTRRVSRNVQWLVHSPISLYLGWISVATVINVAIGLYSLNWNGFGISSTVWTVLMIGVSSVLAFLILFQRQDPIFPLVIVWALVAIALRRWSFLPIAATAMGLALVLAIAWAFQFQRFNLSAVGNKSR
jgi:hypothetical protein